MHWRPQLTAFATQYLGPVATSIRELDKDLVVWASPYNVGNRTRYPASKYMSPAQIGESWRQAFEAAPDFGFVAPQDSTGGQGNSLAVALDFLREIGSAAKLANRTTWANAEIFEYWPRSCVWSPSDHCKGRHPAPWERIQQHIAAEAPIVKALGGKLIAWEWFGDLSPNAQAAGIVPESRASAAAENYQSYLAYMRPNARTARAPAPKPRPIKADDGARAAAVAPPDEELHLPGLQPGFDFEETFTEHNVPLPQSALGPLPLGAASVKAVYSPSIVRLRPSRSYVMAFGVSIYCQKGTVARDSIALATSANGTTWSFLKYIVEPDPRTCTEPLEKWINSTGMSNQVNDPDALQDGDMLRIVYTSVMTPMHCANLGLVSLRVADLSVVSRNDRYAVPTSEQCVAPYGAGQTGFSRPTWLCTLPGNTARDTAQCDSTAIWFDNSGDSS